MAKKKLNNEEQPLPKLTNFEEQFVGVLFNVGHIASKAYKLCKPHVSDETAKVEASKLLTKPNIQHSIELRKLKIRNEEDISLGFLVSELKSIIYELKPFDAVEYSDDGRVINKKDYKSMIAAINSLAKLGGLDNHTQKIEIENNNEAPQEITININKSKK
jgi:hypothetical protein